MENLELMKNSFEKWLTDLKKLENNTELYELIEKKLIEIANEYNFYLYHRNDILGEGNVVLSFFNRDIQKFLTAWANEKGFSSKLCDDLL